MFVENPMIVANLSLECQDGVTVLIKVNEGSLFLWKPYRLGCLCTGPIEDDMLVMQLLHCSGECLRRLQ